MRDHRYETSIQWTGNLGSGTANYRSYGRNFTISVPGKPEIPGSSDPVFRGEATRYNPEEMLVAALSSCHMLAYLHLCAVNNVVVVSYDDQAVGTMTERDNGIGLFTHVQLSPRVYISSESDAELARDLHERAHELCFIANSVNFPVETAPAIVKG